MIIKGFQPTTLLDYPGHISALVFTAGCTFRCPFCYNKSLVENSPDLEELDEKKILDLIKRRSKLIEGVVISGGEPTMYKDLPDFIKKIKELGLKVKLDTNGTNPEMLKSLIDQNLLDFIAMDIKNSPKHYEQTTKVKFDVEKIKKSVEMIMKSKVDYEFRTTAAPCFISRDDFIEICKWLDGAKKYCLQQFRPVQGMIDDSLLDERTYSEDELKDIKDMLKPYFEKVEIRV